MIATRASSASLVLLAAFALLSARASAQALVGRVVDVNGAGVAGVDIDVENNGSGGDPAVSHDFTDAAGNFVTTVARAGVYDLVFTPPRPPATTNLRRRLVNRVVTGTVDLGTIVLTRGVSVSGRVVDAAGQPVGSVDFDVRLPSGANVELFADTSDAFGAFRFAVPSGPIELIVDTTTVPLVVFAPRKLDLALVASASLGNVVIQRGFRISGLLRSNGLAVSGADFDAEVSATGAKLFLQGDTSSAGGAFSWVVPAGTYDVSVCPKVGDAIVARELLGLAVGADVNVGTLVLEPGTTLSGNVQDCDGGPAVGIDVDVTRASGPVPLCRDDTDAAGNYSVVVPFGTLDVHFRHPVQGSDLHTGFVVNGPRVLNGRVSPVAAVVRNGAGVNPLRYQSIALPVLGSSWRTRVDCGGHPAGLALQSIATAPRAGVIGASGQPLIGGAILFRASLAHAGGSVDFVHPVPNRAQLCGVRAYTQVTITGGNRALTNALDVTLGH